MTTHMINEVLPYWTTIAYGWFCRRQEKCLMDSSTGMSYLQNQIHHKKLVYMVGKTIYSMLGLDSPQFVWKLQKVGKGTWRTTRTSESVHL